MTDETPDIMAALEQSLADAKLTRKPIPPCPACESGESLFDGARCPMCGREADDD